MLTVDIHTHILPKNLTDWGAKFGNSRYVRLEHGIGCAKMIADGKTFREITEQSWDIIVRRKDAERAGVDVQVLSTVPVLFYYWAPPDQALAAARELNDHIAGVIREDPRHFAGLGTVPLQSPDLATQEMERCMKDLNLAGIEIGSHVGNWNLDAPELFPFFQEAERLGMAIFVHPWDMLGGERMQKYWLPWLVGMPTETALALCSMIFGGVLERLPKLRVAFAHGGGAFPGILGRIEQGFRARPDLCHVNSTSSPKEHLGRFYVDSLVFDPKTLQHLVDVIGANHIALGSDYPFPLGEEEPGKLIRSMHAWPMSMKERLLSGSALEWLKKFPEDFR